MQCPHRFPVPAEGKYRSRRLLAAQPGRSICGSGRPGSPRVGISAGGGAKGEKVPSRAKEKRPTHGTTNTHAGRRQSATGN
jgi:hypothetical protein